MWVYVSAKLNLVHIQSLGSNWSSVKIAIFISWISTQGKLSFVVQSMSEMGCMMH